MSGGVKFDDGKLPVVAGLIEQFPRALLAVAEVSKYGYKKYGTYTGWAVVENALVRYDEALGRHFIMSRIEQFDPESGLRHRAHLAWNALATLELYLHSEGLANEPKQQRP